MIDWPYLFCKFFAHTIQVPTGVHMFDPLWCARCGRVLNIDGDEGVWERP